MKKSLMIIMSSFSFWIEYLTLFWKNEFILLNFFFCFGRQFIKYTTFVPYSVVF